MMRIVLRPLASSLPIGFFAFGTGTILLTAIELMWVPLPQTKSVLILILAFVVPLELLSGVFAFLARDVGAASGAARLVVGPVDQVGLAGPLVPQADQYPGQALADVGEVHRLARCRVQLVFQTRLLALGRRHCHSPSGPACS